MTPLSTPAAQGTVAEPKTEPKAEYAFGHGKLVIEGGSRYGVPAVFIYPANIGGEVNTSAEIEVRPADAFVEGETVLTFPTEAQADYVIDALYNRTRGSGFAASPSPEALPASGVRRRNRLWATTGVDDRVMKTTDILGDATAWREQGFEVREFVGTLSVPVGVKQRWTLARTIYEARYPDRGPSSGVPHWDALPKAERLRWLPCAEAALTSAPAPEDR